jgi:hypothetical protein
VLLLNCVLGPKVPFKRPQLATKFHTAYWPKFSLESSRDNARSGTEIYLIILYCLIILEVLELCELPPKDSYRLSE